MVLASSANGSPRRWFRRPSKDSWAGSTPSLRVTNVYTPPSETTRKFRGIAMGTASSSPAIKRLEPLYTIPVTGDNIDGPGLRRGQAVSTTAVWYRECDEAPLWSSASQLMDSDGYSRLDFSKPHHCGQRLHQPGKTSTFAPAQTSRSLPPPLPPVNTRSTMSLRHMHEQRSYLPRARCQSAENILSEQQKAAVYKGRGDFYSTQTTSGFSTSLQNKIVSTPFKKTVTFARQVELQATLPNNEGTLQENDHLMCVQNPAVGRRLFDESAQSNMVRSVIIHDARTFGSFNCSVFLSLSSSSPSGRIRCLLLSVANLPCKYLFIASIYLAHIASSLTHVRRGTTFPLFLGVFVLLLSA